MTSLRVRAREAGLISGELPAGPHNDITDVGGVLVGHATLISGEGKRATSRRSSSQRHVHCFRAFAGTTTQRYRM